MHQQCLRKNRAVLLAADNADRNYISPARTSSARTSSAHKSDEAAIKTILEIFDANSFRQKHWLRHALRELLSSDDTQLLPVTALLRQGRTISAAEMLADLAEKRCAFLKGENAQTGETSVAKLYRHAAALLIPILTPRALTLLKKALSLVFDCRETHHMLADCYKCIGHEDMSRQHLMHAAHIRKDKEDQANPNQDTPPTIFCKSRSTVQNLKITPLKFSQDQALKPLKFTGSAYIA